MIVFDQLLARSGTRWRSPVLAVAVGIYLPLEYTSPIFLGGLLAECVDRWHARRGATDLEQSRRAGLLFSSGLIAGEALVGVAIAIPIAITANIDVLALPEALHLGQWPGLAAFGLIAWWLYRSATRTT